MVKYVPDRTGRFSQRPHYEPKELDRECENLIASFLKERHGALPCQAHSVAFQVVTLRPRPEPLQHPAQRAKLPGAIAKAQRHVGPKVRRNVWRKAARLSSVFC